MYPLPALPRLYSTLLLSPPLLHSTPPRVRVRSSRTLEQVSAPHEMKTGEEPTLPEDAACVRRSANAPNTRSVSSARRSRRSKHRTPDLSRSPRPRHAVSSVNLPAGDGWCGPWDRRAVPISDLAVQDLVGDLLEGYGKLMKLASSPRHIIPGHDPLVMDRYPPVSEALRDIAVSLDAEPLAL